MHIKSILLEGFKSYENRTEITGFDPLFNAITGLNGSGKSNILDGICFVLGINNLSHIRARDLQDLVFKNGQAGITTAKVSITFNNINKQLSPVGYELHDEITISRQINANGKEKYLINESHTQKSHIHTLFHSVQLNINNPHFLIMQGRITKVLNMKPPEILSLLEEASGTKMYEIKKLKVLTEITKKDARLKEIDNIINDDVKPMIVKLREEKDIYLKYQKIQREIEQSTKLRIAYHFFGIKNEKKTAEGEVELKNIGLAVIQNELQKLQLNLKDLNEKIKKIEINKEGERNKLTLLETDLKGKQIAEAKVTSSLKNIEVRLKVEEKKQQNLRENLTEDSLTVQNKREELEKMENEMQDSRKTNQENIARLAAAKKRLQSINIGLSSNTDGEEDATLANQLIMTKSQLVMLDTSSKQATMRLTHAKSELEKKRNEIKQSSCDSSVKDRREILNVLREKMTEIQKEMNKLDYREQKEKEKEIEIRRCQLVREYNSLQSKKESIKGSNMQLNFDYSDPEPNFDKQKVKGLLCTLFRVNDVHASAKALEVVAGRKLFHIVVDSDETGKKLLEYGNLKKKVSIIPLNKIVSQSRISKNILEKAERIAGKFNVVTALSLISYDPSVKSAMEFVFGSTFVCLNMDVAKEVAFHPEIQTRTVTLDGEVYDPEGTLFGGSKSKQSSSILVRVEELRCLKIESEEKQKELIEIVKQLQEMKCKAESYHDFKRKFDKKKNKAEILQQTLHQNQHYRIEEEIKSLEREIGNQEAVRVNCLDLQQTLANRAKELEDKIKNLSATRESEIQTAEDEVNKCKKNMESVGSILTEKEKEVDVLKLEIKDIKNEIEHLKQQLSQVDGNIETFKKECQQARENLNSIKDDVRKIEKENKSMKKEIQAVYENQEKILDDISWKKIQIENCLQDVKKQNTFIQKCSDEMIFLSNKHLWIREDEIYFGQPDTAYDFTAIKTIKTSQQLAELEEKKNMLGRNLNPIAMSMLSVAEEKYREFLKKKQIVEADKNKIYAAIKNINEKRYKALVKAWEQVNVNFGSIFSTLLPGARAKLEIPLNGKSILDGLEVKITFGGGWKETLSELSGGQRSLATLSLILSMLLFKPAPIYILDEVDAALDLSHTQNVGEMLSKHFKHSQFIIVSHKDGMIKKANVLFKTSFVDGQSTVTRSNPKQ